MVIRLDAVAQSEPSETSLDAAMRAPSMRDPDIIVLSSAEVESKPKEVVDPTQDLWLSSVDGRHQSPIIPIRVGPHVETFYVHRAILTKSVYFKRALDGDFKEAKEQAIDLPIEDPALFSFVVAFLYEDRYTPIKPAATVLLTPKDKGKGKEDTEETPSEPDSDSSSASDTSARSRRRREVRRRRNMRAIEDRQRKQPGRHRPDCNCPICSRDNIPTCWNCGISPRPPPPGRDPRFGRPPAPPQIIYPPHPHHPRPPHPPNPPHRFPLHPQIRRLQMTQIARMTIEDVQTWASAYMLSVNVYVCAQRYLMTGLMHCIAACIVDNFEVAGVEAAVPAVLDSCKILYEGVSPTDSLLKKVFARVGFLQTMMWKKYPDETASFFMENPELAPLIMKEMGERRELDGSAHDLPAMDRSESIMSVREDFVVNYGR